MFHRCGTVLGVLCLTLSCVTPVSATVLYSVTDLGALAGGSSSRAAGINAAGVVVGTSFGSGGDRAFLYDGAMHDLGVLPGGDYSDACGINGGGQVVGYSGSALQNTRHAFLYSGGSMTDLGADGSTFSQAASINDSGAIVVVVGELYGPGGAMASQYGGGTWTPLGVMPGYTMSSATDVNNSGQIVGYCFAPGAGQRAFRYGGGTMTDLGTLGGPDSSAYAINATGQIVGSAATAGGAWHAFFYSSGTLTDLGTLGQAESSARDINVHQQVVGDVFTSGGAQRAFLCANGTMTDLNALVDPVCGWNLAVATGINDSGQIVGYGTNEMGQTHAFLLTVVPEPSTVALIGTGMVIFLLRLRCQRRHPF
jgi:probable HAF family extracellular repeat protein